MKIYMDVCCLNRPFDDLSQDRVYLEAEAVLAIISRCEKSDWTLLASGAIDFELSKISDVDRLEQVQALYAVASERVNTTYAVEQRAAALLLQGLKPFDSLHVALAESCGADVFLTTDDHILRAAKRVGFSINIANPLMWLVGGGDNR